MRSPTQPPAAYVVYRATSRPNAPESAGYELPGEPGRRDEAAFRRWLTEHDLAAAGRPDVAVLVIREELDEAGLLLEGVLERRRGGASGPYHGPVARIEFTGPARHLRRYQASRDGRLTLLPAADDEAGAQAPGDPAADSFAGEDAAVRAALRPDVVILDRRAPGPPEERLGLSAILHVRRPDGAELGCGVGWHGTTPYVLVADFPRFDEPLKPPPEIEAAVREVIATRNLIRHETRLDDRGYCVIARRRGSQDLVAIRLDGQAARVEPYTPGRTPAAAEDQRRWMIYAESYEGRTILDSWPEGDGGDIAVVTVDQDQEAWRHVIDADGIECSRRAGNDDAAAVLHRERSRPAPTGTPAEAASHDAPPDDMAPDGTTTDHAVPAAAADSATAADYPAPPDSLLAKVRAHALVIATLRAAIEACDGSARTVPDAAVAHLRALRTPLALLNTRFAAGSLHRLLLQAGSGAMALHDFATALEDLVVRLRDELALTRVVFLPTPARQPMDEPPFGISVEVHFPAAAYDIDEAVHCLTLRRPTAAVLHAMQVMRHGLAEAERLPNMAPLIGLSWPRMIAAMREAAADRPALAEALGHVRRVWQAPGLTPAAKYTEEEAEAVLDAVAGFMRTLAGSIETGR